MILTQENSSGPVPTFDKPAQLGDWHPLLVLWLATATPPSPPTATPAAPPSAARPKASTETSSTTGWCSCWCVRHCCGREGRTLQWENTNSPNSMIKFPLTVSSNYVCIPAPRLLQDVQNFQEQVVLPPPPPPQKKKGGGAVNCKVKLQLLRKLAFSVCYSHLTFSWMLLLFFLTW